MINRFYKMFYNVNILISCYVIFGFLQQILAENTYTYSMAADEIIPLMEKLAEFADCNTNKTKTNNYDFIFTIEEPGTSCSLHSSLRDETSLKKLINNELKNPLYVLITDQGKTNLPEDILESVNKSTIDKKLLASTKNVDSITKAPFDLTTVDPVQRKLKEEKEARNDYIAAIITVILVLLIVASVVGCAIAKYIKTVRQSGTYDCRNP